MANADKTADEDRGAYDDKSKGLIAIVMTALAVMMLMIVDQLAVFLSALDTTIITTALPVIADHFHSSAGYTWVGSAYLLANAAATPLWGKLSDIFGRKPMLLFANVVFFVGSLVAALSNSIGMLIAARAVQGIGGAGLLTLVDIAISDLFSLRTRGTYLGIIGGVWAIAAAIGPVIGGALTQRVSWRWCFYINLPLDGLAFIVILFFLKLPTPRVPVIEGLRAIDWLGNIFVTGGTVMFLLGLQYGGVTHPWNSAIVLCLIIIGAFCLGIFILVEWRVATYPLMQLDVFKSRSNAAVLILTFLHGFTFIAAFYYLPLFFQVSRGASALLSGVYLLPAAIPTGLAAFATGAFIGITGNYLIPIYVGVTFMTLGFGLFIDLHADSSWAKIIIYQIIAGIGMGSLFQPPLVALQAGIKQRDIASNTATFNFLRLIAESISLVVGQVVFQNQMKSQTPYLISTIGPELAEQIGAHDAAASTSLIHSLQGMQKNVVERVFANSLRPAWIMYTAVAGLAIVAALFISRTVLTKDHEIAEVGLEAEKKHAADRKAERAARGNKSDGQGPWV
ncbi:hypothetical protein DOTSEDRAFT_129861 [Dothistroma septosporum NZE10]|uniref:Efflux pump dotC n=1 Tax=Dothistroma septosporum (strain NZE10 / CBS 128990) TaxID=675120 RepID=N1PN68_DOTSN|nr:hypothetical protein DOTSEDRAFT_129861 [Dothistroma septosporum NZE10]